MSAAGDHEVVPTAIVMAKRPLPGRVKLRLVHAGFLDAEAAADLAAAMLACTLARLRERYEVVLALDAAREGADPGLRHEWRLGVDAPRVVDQGEGDLGRRIEHAWRQVGIDRPVVFLGADSPDVPDEALAAIGAALGRAQVAIGPTDDGGYWALAARAFVPAVLHRVDWGTESVYHQTCRRADEAGISWTNLPAWVDVDRPEDVVALRRRLTSVRETASRVGVDRVTPGPIAAQEPLRRLLERLDSILGARGAGPARSRDPR